MKKTQRTVSNALVVASLALAAIAAVLYCRSVASSFDITIGHFDPGAQVTLFIVLSVCSLVLAVASGVTLMKKCSVVAERKYAKPMIIAFVALGALLLADAVIALPSAFKAIAAASKTTAGVGKEQFVGLAAPIFEIAAAVSFIISTGEKRTEKARAYLSFTAIIWALLATLSVYFNSGRAINSPIKAILLCLTVFNMLFITEDARFFIGSQKAASFRAICAVCASLGIAFALPNAIFAALALVSKESVYAALGLDLLGSLIMFAIPVCAALRIVTSGSYLGDPVSPKHEKKESDAFGNAPEEGGTFKLDLEGEAAGEPFDAFDAPEETALGGTDGETEAAATEAAPAEEAASAYEAASSEETAPTVETAPADENETDVG